MSSKKLILAIFILLGVFIFFIRHAFISLQTVTLNIETHEIENIEDPFKTVLEFLEEYKEQEFVENFSLAKQQIVLVDNIKENAILWNDINDNENKQLIYEEIPDSIKYVNSYMIKLNNQPTVIINCDEILGDINQRILADTYNFLKLKKSKLNPKEISYFPSFDENIKERFLRNQMIKALLEAYLNNESLEDFRFYFEKWQEEIGDSYKSIAEYDWHEGSKEYMIVKVKQLLDEDFDLSRYMEGKINKYNFFDKEQEYGLIGMLMILYTEKKDIKIDLYEQFQDDIYKKILYKTPYISREIDKDAIKTFADNYNKYNKDIKNVIESVEYHDVERSITIDEIISETYTHTFMIDKNYYVYENYQARLKDKTIISKEYIIAKVSPYRIEYYFSD